MTTTTLPAGRQRLIEILTADPDLSGVAVQYSLDRSSDSLTGPTGRREAIWWSSEAQIEHRPAALGTPVGYFERWTCALVVEVLPVDSGSTQFDTDERCAWLAGVAMDALSRHPHFGAEPPDPWVQWTATPTAIRYEGGQLGAGTAARIEIDITTEATRC